jgi:tRNA(Ile)-lysidine synthase
LAGGSIPPVGTTLELASSEPCSIRPETSLPKSTAPDTANPKTPDGFEQRLLARARAAGLAPGDRFVVGFSGGCDSLALAAALRRVEAVLGVSLQLLHVDHRLRPASADDAQRAADLATALGLDFGVIAIPAPPQTIHPGVGLEEAARRERYRVLFEEASRVGARAVVTAHHQDDQAETVLLHLLRGGGVHGAKGMDERALAPFPLRDADYDISQKSESPWLWRPLLRESRASIDAYVGLLGLTPIEDPSNADQSLRRNALRHQVLPLLEEQFPGAKAALARFAMLAAEDDRLLSDLADEAAAATVQSDGLLVASLLREQPLALQRRVVRQWLSRVTGSAAFSADRTDAVLDLAREGAGGTVEIGEGWTVRRARGMLRVERLAKGTGGRGK